MPSALRRVLPLVLLGAAVGAGYATGVWRYMSWDTLAANRERLLFAVADLGLSAPLAYAALYAGVTTLFVPGALILTILGGFLFGTVVGAFSALVGATLGATAVFLIARSSLGEPLRRRAGPFLQRVEHEFRLNGVWYLLAMRLVPVIPFYIVNLVPAFFGITLRQFVLATFFGMIPAAIVYASIGAGLGALVAEGGVPNLAVMLEPRFLLPVLGLAVLALLPVFYKMLRRPSTP